MIKRMVNLITFFSLFGAFLSVNCQKINVDFQPPSSSKLSTEISTENEKGKKFGTFLGYAMFAATGIGAAVASSIFQKRQSSASKATDTNLEFDLSQLLLDLKKCPEMPIKKVECSVCYDDLDCIEYAEQCVCIGCTRGHIIVNLSSNGNNFDAIVWPARNCKEIMPLPLIANILGKEEFEKRYKVHLANELVKLGEDAFKAKYPNVGVINAAAAQAKRDNEDMSDFVKNYPGRNCRSCPSCKNIVQRKEACAHMTCVCRCNCGYCGGSGRAEFCIFCGDYWRDGHGTKCHCKLVQRYNWDAPNPLYEGDSSHNPLFDWNGHINAGFDYKEYAGLLGYDSTIDLANAWNAFIERHGKSPSLSRAQLENLKRVIEFIWRSNGIDKTCVLPVLGGQRRSFWILPD